MVGPFNQISPIASTGGVVPAVGDDPHVDDRRDRLADALRIRDVRGAEVRDRRTGGLREAVAVAGRGAGRCLLVDAAHELGRYERRAGRDAAQRLDRRTLRLRRFEQLEHRRRHAGDRRDAFALDDVDGFAGVPTVREDDLAARHREGQQERLQPADVEQRQREQRRHLRCRRRRGRLGRGARRGRVHREVHALHEEVGEVALRLHRALRSSRRAGRVHDRRVRVDDRSRRREAVGRHPRRCRPTARRPGARARNG